MNENALELREVTKSFMDFKLDKVSFSLPKGYIMGLVGPNGAGKTTTIRLILNMIAKEQGSIFVFREDNVLKEQAIKQKIAVVFDTSYFVDEWSIAETEKAISPFYDEWDHTTFMNLLEQFQLSPKMKVGKLSRGMQMRLMLSCAFSHNAKLLILDEPTSGLDPLARDELLGMLQKYIQDGEKSVLFSTHITTDLEKVADYITILSSGKMEFTGSMEDLSERYVVIKGSPDTLSEELKKDMIGFRMNKLNFEGLILRNAIKRYKGYVFDTPTIDDIVIFMSKKGVKA